MLWGYDVTTKTIDLVGALQAARGDRGLSDELEALQPPFPHYRPARRMAGIYRDLLTKGEPPMVPELAATVRKKSNPVAPGPGCRHWPPGCAPSAICRPTPPSRESDPPRYSGPIVEAVKRFQVRHGLEADGVIGAGTIRAINVPLVDRVRQIELAMERMRWLPKLDEGQNIFVNVANFRLWANDPPRRASRCG